MATDTAPVKRQLIAQANQTMFLSVAAAAIVVGVTGTLLNYLVQVMMFNNKVIEAQDKSISNIQQNIKNIEDLETKMKTLQTNTALIASRASNEDNALRVILDSLPSSENTAALGASLSERLLFANEGQNSLTIENISITSGGSQSTNSTTATPAAGAAEGSAERKPTPISFTFSVSSSSPASIQKIIQNLERSIRTINVTSYRFTTGRDKITLNVDAQAYYLTYADLELRKQTVTATEEVKKSSGSIQTGTTTGSK